MSREFMEKLITDQQKTIENLSVTIEENTKRHLRDSELQAQKHAKEIQRLNQTISNLSEQIRLLSARIFGSTSEKTNQTDGQLSLFDLEEKPEVKDFPIEEEEAVAKVRKKKSTKEERYRNLPVVEINIDLEDDDKFCDYCNTPLDVLGKEVVREELRIIPAKMERVCYVRTNYICSTCKADDVPYIKKPSNVPAPLIAHSFASPILVAHIMYQKYVNALPLYRQEKDFATMGATIGRATLANWINTCSTEYLVKIYDYMHEELLKREVLMSDETHSLVLKEEGKSATARSYMWIHRTGNDGLASIILYDYQPSRSGLHAVNFLKDFSGFHYCDGFSGYNRLKNVTRCACLAHIRRKFYEGIPQNKASGVDTTPAEQGFAYCNRLFKLEEKYIDLSSDERKEKRLETEKPILDEFFVWLNQQNPPKGSKLQKAVTYALNQWEYMNNYLLDGRCQISNNWTENSVRPYVLIRKNSLFHDTAKGARASAIICSIIETAKANQVNVEKYLEHLLTILPGYEESAGMESLMPWSDTIQQKFKS